MKRKSHCTLVVTVFCIVFLSCSMASQTGVSWSHNSECPKAFIENKGQFGECSPADRLAQVLYAVDDNGTFIGFSKKGVAYSFLESRPAPRNAEPEPVRNSRQWEREEEKANTRIIKKDRISFVWEGANPDAELIAESETDHYYSYTIGKGRKERNLNHVRGYRKLIYKNLYPHIDVEYEFHPVNGVKYSLILHPGAHASDVRMKYQGKLSLNEKGDVLVPTVFGDITDHAPLSFYAGSPSSVVQSRFRLQDHTVSFELESYDASRALTIDPWTSTPVLNNSKRIWETETDGSGNVYIYGGDSPIKLLKYNSTGTLQWTYTSPWDTTGGTWLGGFVTDPSGNSYMTTGSKGQIAKITSAGALAWSNNPTSGLTAYEYWSLAFNCDLTHLVVGGSRSTFGFTPVIVGTVMEINLTNGALVSTVVVGYGPMSPAPKMQEVSSICTGPTGSYYFLTLDTVGSINTALSTINFKTDNGYNFNYYIPGYTINAKQPISAIRACSTAFYTQDGVKVDKRNLSTGAVIASAAIPGGITSTVPPFAGGGNLNGNGGLDIDNCGNVYVGSGNQVIKYDANLNLLSSQPTSFAVYDVDVNSNGEVIACGYGGGQGYVQSFNFSACAQIPFVCVATPLSITSTSTPINCNGQCTASATAHPAGGTGAYTYSWNTTPSQSTQTASSLCAGTYTVSVKDGAGTSNTSVVTISQPAVITATATSTNSNCSSPSGSATVTASGGTGTLSYSWSPSGGTAATANNLSAGNYTCTVSDAKGCTKAVPITVGGASPPAVAATPVNPLCNGASTGSISLSASGGTSPYTYSWSPAGGTGATASSLPAGTYTSTVTDAMGCSKSQTITLTQPAAISASASATNASCGNSNGTASVTASGGTGTLSYSWTPSGGTAASASSLPAGTYTCTVTDANSCQKKVIVSVNSTGGPSVTMASQSNPVCNGTATGSATASVTGGTSPYTYSWSPAGGNTSSASNLPAGTYTVSVKDASNCVQTQTVTLTDPPAITGTTSSASATCGSNNGSATVSASGGTGALSYSWSPSGGTASTASSLSAGSYTCMVTDSKSCSKALVVSVTSNGGAAITLSTHSDVSCHAGNNGSASFSVSGGSAPYTYSWAPSGGNSSSASSLSAGTYTINVTDASGCRQSKTVVIAEPAVISVTMNSTSTACGSSTGSATINASGGTGAFTYSWSPSGGTAATASGLPAGNYTCTVKDANACSSSFQVSVSSTGGPALAVSAQSNISCNGGTNGSATVSATGGTTPYTYSWNTTPPQTSAGASGLAAGTYTIAVTDAGGCVKFQTVTITQPSTITLNLSSAPACGLQNGSASANVTGGVSPYTYSWQPAGGSASVSGGLSSGTYTCSISDANGCVKTGTVPVSADSIPVALSGADVLISYGNSTTLHGGGGGTYSWSPPAGLSCTTCQNTMASPTVTTTYCLMVTNTHGCSDSSCVNVRVDFSCGEVFVPNFFSPNDDGENDQLCVYGRCIQKIDFAVFDRWGEKVFETTDPHACWDGSFKGQKMNTAVFVYYLHADLVTGESITQKGNISLVR